MFILVLSLLFVAQGSSCSPAMTMIVTEKELYYPADTARTFDSWDWKYLNPFSLWEKIAGSEDEPSDEDKRINALYEIVSCLVKDGANQCSSTIEKAKPYFNYKKKPTKSTTPIPNNAATTAGATERPTSLQTPTSTEPTTSTASTA